MTELSEQLAALYERVRHGDSKAGDELCDRLFNSVLTVLTRNWRDRDSAEEAANAAAFITWQAIVDGKIENPLSLASYAIRVGNRKCGKFIENRERESTSSDILALFESRGAGPDDRLNWERAVEKATQLISQLSETDQDIIFALYVHGESVDSIADRYGKEAHWVYVRLNRARTKLRDRYYEDGS